MVVKIALQYVLIHPSFDLHRDEYLHLDQADHPAWGFISVPPLTSWIAKLISLLGNDVFWVKFFPALFGAFTMFFTWKIVEELKGSLFAKVIAALAIMTSIVLRLNILFQPNSFEVMGLAAFYWLLVRYMGRQQPRYLYGMAVVLAFCFLNKYNVLFPLAGVGLAWIILPQRKFLFNRHVIWAALFFLLMISPNIKWQIDNGIPFFRHMKELADTQLVNMSRAGFLKEQVLFFLNSIFLLVFGILGLLRRKEWRSYLVVLLSFVITLSLYVWFRAKGYYSTGLYPVMIAFGAVYFSDTVRSLAWRLLALVLMLALFIPFVRLAFPYMSAENMSLHRETYSAAGLLTWEDGKEHHLPQDFADMRGWREMAYITDSAVGSLREKDKVLIIANNYGQAGAINYYGTSGVRAVSFNADYLYWFPVGKPVKHVIRIMEVEEDDDDPQRMEERSLCDTLILAGEVKDTLARERGTKIWIMKNVKGDVWPLIIKEIEDHK